METQGMQQNDHYTINRKGNSVKAFTYSGFVKHLFSTGVVENIISEYEPKHKIFTAGIVFKSGFRSLLIISKEDAVKEMNFYNSSKTTGEEEHFEFRAQYFLLRKIVRRPDVVIMFPVSINYSEEN